MQVLTPPAEEGTDGGGDEDFLFELAQQPRSDRAMEETAAAVRCYCYCYCYAVAEAEPEVGGEAEAVTG